MPGFIKSLPPTALIIAIGMLVGVSFTLSKFVAIADTGPIAALFWQLCAASITLSAAAAATGRHLQCSRRHLTYYLGAGLFGVSGPALIGYSVLEHVSTGFYSALVTLSPLFTFAITALAERRMLPAHRLVGIVIGLAGISLATQNSRELKGVASFWVVLAAASPLLLAMGNVFRSRAYPPGGDPVMLAAGTLLLQLVLTGILLLATGGIAETAALSLGTFSAIAGTGLITALSYALTFKVQRRTDGVGFAQVGYFATLFGIAFGALVFREPVHLSLVISLLVLFLGLAITNGHTLPPGLWRRLINRGRRRSQASSSPTEPQTRRTTNANYS
ncbi:DMT family transporter [Leisingera sp. SS27]|uniref:DMT family transporter n=1 Tax=Leisingera sp. SS27 TaxID=2979462 RepID=UPI00232FEAB2|nr:DMT family transporter [Leisingera sp. SS27]MDC0657763.1 DMT family transporter [Leisingera sp. SS27]